MRDVERELRELGRRVRDAEATVGLREDTLHAARRRRVATVTTALAMLIMLALGGTYALGTFGRQGSELDPADGARPTFARFFSVFSAEERVVVEVDSQRGTVCTTLTSLENHASLRRVEIVRDLRAREAVVTVRPNDDGFVPTGGGAECVAGVEAETAQAIIDEPQDHFVLVDGDDSRVKVSALTRGNGDGNHPTGPHLTIASGRFLGVEWEYYGYKSNDGVCLEFAWGPNSGGGCGFRHPGGDYVLSVAGASVLREPGGATVAEFDGQVSDAVKRLTVKIDDGEPRVLELVEPPRRLGLEDRRFVHLIDSRKLDSDSRVWLVAYNANNEVLERQEVRGLQAPEGEHQFAPSEDTEGFAAIWPEDASAEAEEACAAATKEDASHDGEAEDVMSMRYDPASIVLDFGAEVLGWEDAIVTDRSGQPEFAENRTVYELRRGPQGASPRPPVVIVDAIEVQEGCWSVASVSRSPDRRPTGVGISVRGRNVEVDFDDLGAETVAFEIGHGAHTMSSWPAGRDGRITARLTYAPDDTGHFLILFKDEDGNVFSAAGAPLPAGDFVAG